MGPIIIPNAGVYTLGRPLRISNEAKVEAKAEAKAEGKAEGKAEAKVTEVSLTTAIPNANRPREERESRRFARTFITSKGDTRMDHGGRGFLPHRRRLHAVCFLERIRDVSTIPGFCRNRSQECGDIALKEEPFRGYSRL